MFERIKNLWRRNDSHEFERYSNKRLLGITMQDPDSPDAKAAKQILDHRQHQKAEERANLSLVFSLLALIISALSLLKSIFPLNVP